MFNKKYDWLIIGSGLFGTVFARLMTDFGKKVLIYEKKDHVGGNCYDKNINGIIVPSHGPHYFHTDNKEVWNFVNKFGEFNQKQPKVLAQYKEKLYSLPFSMITFNQLWGCKSPKEAQQKIESQKIKIENPKNLEEFALSVVGPEIYKIFIKDYSEKQWNKPCKHLPASIIKRIPLRFTFDDCYWSNATYSGMPIKGYTNLVEKMLEGIDVEFNVDFNDTKTNITKKILYTGQIDKFFNYKYGTLEYRSLKFKTIESGDDFQGVAQINYTEKDIPFTRIVEHKHFYDKPEQHKNSMVTFEYPENWDKTKDPYYPINDEKNNKILAKYQEEKIPNVIFGGRLGIYKYSDMDSTIFQAMELVKKELNHM
jgi:UDP-galactopyranose mutase